MATTSAPMLLGHDLSTILQCEKQGVRYYDFNSTDPKLPEQIIAAHGANLIRLRLWVNPPAGYSDYPSLLSMAKRIKAANLKLLLCLHLSDYWADPGKQFTPGAWANQPYQTLTTTLANYVTFIIESLQQQGTPPFIVAVGNEVSNGILWPVGALNNTAQFTGLLKSGLRAAQQKGIATMVHINNGQDKGLVTWFMNLMKSNEVEFDFLGLSFYPGDGAKLDGLQESLGIVAERYNKAVIVVEVAENWAYGDGRSRPETQEASLRAVVKVVSEVPRGLGAGVCYWESGWVQPGEAYPGEGNHYWNRALWNEQGMPLPALKCYEGVVKGEVKGVVKGRRHYWGGQKHEEL